MSSPILPDPLLPQKFVYPTKYEWVSWILAAGFLFLVLKAGLLGALIAGLAVFVCVHSLAQKLPSSMDSALARKTSLILITTVLVGGIVLGCLWIASFLNGSGNGLAALLTRMGEIMSELKQVLPAALTENWPSSVSNFNHWFGEFLKSHAAVVQTAGTDVLKSLSRIIIGMVLGGLIAVAQEGKSDHVRTLFSQALVERIDRFTLVFTQVVSAQLKISFINTVFTMIFLSVVLPLTGNELPFTKTMIILTFVLGMIPVLGNLMSNTIITIIALSTSLWIAVSALSFLIVIHKVEYFLNARIVGSQIQAKAWELLISMLIMEACFGLPGVIAAPIYYAYIKRELKDKKMI